MRFSVITGLTSLTILAVFSALNLSGLYHCEHVFGASTSWQSSLEESSESKNENAEETTESPGTRVSTQRLSKRQIFKKNLQKLQKISLRKNFIFLASTTHAYHSSQLRFFRRQHQQSALHRLLRSSHNGSGSHLIS
jgi:hypothetical protein